MNLSGAASGDAAGGASARDAANSAGGAATGGAASGARGAATGARDAATGGATSGASANARAAGSASARGAANSAGGAALGMLDLHDILETASNFEQLHAVLQDRRFRQAAEDWLRAESGTAQSVGLAAASIAGGGNPASGSPAAGLAGGGNPAGGGGSAGGSPAAGLAAAGTSLAAIDADSRARLAKLGPQQSLFGVGILQNNRFYYADLLSREKDGSLTLTLFKPGARLRERYLQEADWIRAGFAAAGFESRLLRLVVPNREYVHAVQGGPESDFFQIVPATHDLKHLRSDAESLVRRVQNTLRRVPTLLEFEPAVHGQAALCAAPHSCPYCAPLLEKLPQKKKAALVKQTAASVQAPIDTSIHHLFRAGDLALELVQAGVQTFAQLGQAPSALKRKLKPRHRIQAKCFEKLQIYLDTQAIKASLGQLQFPLYFLDFETTSEAVPRHPGQRAWEHIPFAFSLTRLDSPDSEAKVDVCIVPPGLDPRRTLADELVAHLGKEGSILVYGSKFERTVMQGLADGVPERSAALKARIGAIFDMQEIFSQFWYYHPAQGSRISLKVLVPIFAPDLDYANLEISEGAAAAFGYYALANQGSLLASEQALLPGRADFLEALRRYSAVDTLALARIYQELRRLCSTDAQASSNV